MQNTEINFQSVEFLNKIKSLDSKAVSEFVRAYSGDLFKGAKGLGFNDVMTEELVQNVWLTFFDVIPNFQAQSQIKTFLFGILYNKAKELRREYNKFENHDPIDEIMEERFDENGAWVKTPIDPEQFYASSQILDLIQKCIDALPLKQRMAFCLKEIDEHKSSEICNILELSVTNLGVILFRAKNRLRECIESKALQNTK